MANKSEAAQAAHQVAQVQHVQKADQIRQIDTVNKTEKARLDKVQIQDNAERYGTKTDPVTQKGDVSKATSAITGLFANIEKGQVTMDKLITGGLSGKNFSNSELLALQAGMYKYSQELELTSKVVEKATSGLKDTLKTQV
ncbi:MAG: ATP-dependent helicase HrpB [Archangiaceae bacterium]|nr:ATP-dependent helicase HrpB [Archangiaceae bacterium]